ncbi:MAG TPA: DUF3187 family protein [Gemmatimonadales bacterium]|nr:DUF3187 family protein [Gemmatimonadales bacterium]
MNRTARLPALALAAWLLTAAHPLPAQGLPAYSSMNPMVQRRSGLATLPWVEAGKRWRVSWLTDYASIIEYADLPEVQYLQDAELMRLELTATRGIGSRGFLLVSGSLQGAYDGFLDGFLDWYHDLTGFEVAPRKLRPENEFAYQVAIAGEPPAQYHASSAYLGDLRIGAGMRHSRHWLTAFWVTLPTNTGPDGFRKGVPSFNATTTLRSDFGNRFTYEGTLGAGYTADHGDFSELQQTLFLMVTQGLRARVTGPLHLYANLIYHSALYHDTGTRGLDARELTIDTGGFLKFRRGPEWILGLTEDLEPSGPAIDVTFRIGARW